MRIQHLRGIYPFVRAGIDRLGVDVFNWRPDDRRCNGAPVGPRRVGERPIDPAQALTHRFGPPTWTLSRCRALFALAVAQDPVEEASMFACLPVAGSMSVADRPRALVSQERARPPLRRGEHSVGQSGCRAESAPHRANVRIRRRQPQGCSRGLKSPPGLAAGPEKTR